MYFYIVTIVNEASPLEATIASQPPCLTQALRQFASSCEGQQEILVERALPGLHLRLKQIRKVMGRNGPNVFFLLNFVKLLSRE